MSYFCFNNQPKENPESTKLYVHYSINVQFGTFTNNLFLPD